jgi:hypothetical protein
MAYCAEKHIMDTKQALFGSVRPDEIITSGRSKFKVDEGKIPTSSQLSIS